MIAVSDSMAWESGHTWSKDKMNSDVKLYLEIQISPEL